MAEKISPFGRNDCELTSATRSVGRQGLKATKVHKKGSIELSFSKQ